MSTTSSCLPCLPCAPLRRAQSRHRLPCLPDWLPAAPRCPIYFYCPSGRRGPQHLLGVALSEVLHFERDAVHRHQLGHRPDQQPDPARQPCEPRNASPQRDQEAAAGQTS